MSNRRSDSDRPNRHRRRHDQTSMRDDQTPYTDPNYPRQWGMPTTSGARQHQEDGPYGGNVESQYNPSHQSWQSGSGGRSHPSTYYYPTIAEPVDSTRSTNTMGRSQYPPSISRQHGQAQVTQASSSNWDGDRYPPSSAGHESLTAHTGA